MDKGRDAAVQKAEENLDALFDEAFKANDGPCLDYVTLKFELRRLRHIETAHNANAGQWVPIRTAEDLPKEEGNYVVWLRSADELAFRWMNVRMPDYCIKYYSAWMPIPAYVDHQPEAHKSDSQGGERPPLTKESLSKMTGAELADLPWEDVRQALGGKDA